MVMAGILEDSLIKKFMDLGDYITIAKIQNLVRAQESVNAVTSNKINSSVDRAELEKRPIKCFRCGKQGPYRDYCKVKVHCSKCKVNTHATEICKAGKKKAEPKADDDDT